MNETIWKTKWSNEQIKAMLIEQFQAFWSSDTGIERQQLTAVIEAAKIPHAVVVSGLRRVGKSTLLAQMGHRLGKKNFYYINFEDDRFIDFKPEDITHLHQVLTEIFDERKIFIVDEIQNITGWETFVRRFMDLGCKFYISGSNASLLSKELGTRLTGRYVPIELFPFSFAEFLNFKGGQPFNLGRLTTTATGRLQKELHTYLQTGGIADSLKYPSLPLLRTLYDDVLYRDIVAPYHIDAVQVIKELSFSLMSNPAGLISYNKLKEQLRVGSVNTIKKYVGYLENSWLLFTLNVYSYSVKRQQIAPKKVYCIDTGLGNSVGFAFSPNIGKWLENAIFLALRREYNDIYYCTSPKGYEVDFFLPQSGRLIQVCHNFANKEVQKREIRAIEDTIKELKVRKTLILTDMNMPDITLHGVTVSIRSAAEWLLEISHDAGKVR